MLMTMYYLTLENVFREYVAHEKEVMTRNHELALRSQEQETARLKQQVDELNCTKSET
jgi:DNA gyrase/topoisomerase IV subunit A